MKSNIQKEQKQIKLYIFQELLTLTVCIIKM